MKKVGREEEADRFIELAGAGSWESVHGPRRPHVARRATGLLRGGRSSARPRA
ncbi:hypothetical protein [Sorangium sp. So ce388]|uniref:hypothetical protein n=1 Tax=Sorangium sp. So ce388 TaxID=3133309 RepID=UPI003F5C6DB6